MLCLSEGICTEVYFGLRKSGKISVSLIASDVIKRQTE
jgi:hypothetical protein